ncbi:MAG: hypothetical protein ABI595_12065 [Actinomycetota bacterium]
MRPKTVVLFWAAVAAAVFLLGGTVSSVEAFVRHASVVNTIVLTVSVIGLAIAGLIAGRILVVLGRAQRGP